MTTNAVGNVDWWITHGRGVHLKATERNRIVGVVLVKEYWNLCSLFVDPSMQKQGIGKVLLSTAIASCLGKSPYNAVRLNAAPAAVPFYARHGFTPLVPTRPLPPGFAAMELRFDGQASEHQNTSTGLSFKR